MTVDYGVAKVRPATLSDAEALAPTLRQADLREIEASTTLTPLAALEHSLTVSSKAYAIETPEGVVGLFGVAGSDEQRFGSVWMVGSDKLLPIRYTFLRHSRKWLDELFGEFRTLGNIVDERNRVHVEWLRWLGFRFLRRIPCGLKGEVFIEFVKLRDS
jgi:hypothetical protein